MISLWNQEENTSRVRRSCLWSSYASSARNKIQSRAGGVATGDLPLNKTLTTIKTKWNQEQNTCRPKRPLLPSGYPSSARNSIHPRALGRSNNLLMCLDLCRKKSTTQKIPIVTTRQTETLFFAVRLSFQRPEQHPVPSLGRSKGRVQLPGGQVLGGQVGGGDGGPGAVALTKPGGSAHSSSCGNGENGHDSVICTGGCILGLV
jgi:hypothetical protein